MSRKAGGHRRPPGGTAGGEKSVKTILQLTEDIPFPTPGKRGPDCSEEARGISSIRAYVSYVGKQKNALPSPPSNRLRDEEVMEGADLQEKQGTLPMPAPSVKRDPICVFPQKGKKNPLPLRRRPKDPTGKPKKGKKLKLA